MTDWTIKNQDIKRYPHFDQPLRTAEIMAIVTDPKRVASNKFYPFLKYDKRWQPFRELSKKKAKSRRIRYASRRDAYIFAYYRHQLAALYEAELVAMGIEHCPIAYRKIPMSDGSGRGKCNIQFAHDAIRMIRKIGDCCVLAVDISSYFDSIDHEKLKELWCRLLGVEFLPDDHFAVFKNITKYHAVDRISVYRRLGYFGEKATAKGGQKIEGYLVPFNEVPIQLCSPEDFREKIAGGDPKLPSLIEPNKEAYGIPQGAPISDLLANIYLLDFDKELDTYARSLGGHYMRYSDDILLILPVDRKKAIAINGELPSIIKKYGDELVIKPEKTSVVEYRETDDGQEFELLEGKGANGLEYLGFRYDGKKVFLRDATLSNLYRKLTKACKKEAMTLIKRYPSKSLQEVKDLANVEQIVKRFDRVENFEDALSHRDWTFRTYVRRSVDEFGELGSPIPHQVKNIRSHAEVTLERSIEKLFPR